MKQLITKSDGVTPTKSKVHALQFLEKNGIDKTCLIEENGQFYYIPSPQPSPEMGEGEQTTQAQNDSVDCHADNSVINENKEQEQEEITVKAVDVKPVSWETEVFDKNNERTKLFIPGTDIQAVVLGKHPAGQNRSKSAFEISINGENFIMSVELLSKIFKVIEG